MRAAPIVHALLAALALLTALALLITLTPVAMDWQSHDTLTSAQRTPDVPQDRSMLGWPLCC